MGKPRTLVHRAADYIGATYTRPSNGEKIVVDAEMAEAVQFYVDQVVEWWERFEDDGHAVLETEKIVSLEWVAPGLFGSVDARIIHAPSKSAIQFDYKHGSGIFVENDRNEQMAYYAVGTQGDFPQLRSLKAIIVQPRAGDDDDPETKVREDDYSHRDLREWAKKFALAATAARQSNPPAKVGDWCGFCPAVGICPEQTKLAADAAKIAFPDDIEPTKAGAEVVLPDPSLLTPGELGNLLRFADIFEAWFKGVQKYALAQAVDGGEIPIGFKLVEGRQGNRVWADEQKAAEALRESLMLDEEEIYERKLVSPAGVEKLVGKKEAQQVTDPLVTRSPGSPKLVVEEDRRPALPAQNQNPFEGEMGEGEEEEETPAKKTTTKKNKEK